MCVCEESEAQSSLRDMLKRCLNLNVIQIFLTDSKVMFKTRSPHSKMDPSLRILK
jgi:hypothetical protein